MSVLSDLSTQLETETEQYAQDVYAAAVAENDAERVELMAFARLRDEGQAVGAAEKLAKLAALDERAKARIGEAVTKASHRKVRSLEVRITAAMSHQKFIGGQT